MIAGDRLGAIGPFLVVEGIDTIVQEQAVAAVDLRLLVGVWHRGGGGGDRLGHGEADDLAVGGGVTSQGAEAQGGRGRIGGEADKIGHAGSTGGKGGLQRVTAERGVAGDGQAQARDGRFAGIRLNPEACEIGLSRESGDDFLFHELRRNRGDEQVGIWIKSPCRKREDPGLGDVAGEGGGSAAGDGHVEGAGAGGVIGHGGGAAIGNAIHIESGGAGRADDCQVNPSARSVARDAGGAGEGLVGDSAEPTGPAVGLETEIEPLGIISSAEDVLVELREVRGPDPGLHSDIVLRRIPCRGGGGAEEVLVAAGEGVEGVIDGAAAVGNGGSSRCCTCHVATVAARVVGQVVALIGGRSAIAHPVVGVWGDRGVRGGGKEREDQRQG